MQIHITKRDAIWSYIGTVVSMGANFFMLPFLMYFLDSDMLGLWYVFVSIGTITSLFDFGFAVTFARNITYCWSGASELKKENVSFTENSQPNFSLMKEVLYTSKFIYALISVTALIFLVSVGSLYINYLTRNIKSIIPLISWLIYAIAVFLNLYYGYYASFLRGVGAVTQANKNILYARAAHIILMIILLFLGTGILGACVAYLAYGIVFRFLGKYHFYKYQNIGEHLKNINTHITKQKLFEVFNIVWHNAWREGLISICDYLCSQASVIICSLYLTLAQTGVYSIGVQIATAIMQISKTLYNAKQPELQNAYINSDLKTMQKTMSLVVTAFIYLFIIGIIGTIFVGLPILKLVKPSAVISIDVLLAICSYQILLGFRDCYASYFSCTNRILYLKSYIFSALLGLILAFFSMGVLDLGIWGLIFSQLFSQIIFNVWYWCYKAHQELQISFTQLMKSGSLAYLNIFHR